MSTISAEAKIKILLSILRTIDASPNMQEVTDELVDDSELGIDTRKTARRRYKTIVEADGKYLLTAENKVVFKDSDTDNNAAAPPASRAANTASAAVGEDPEDGTVSSDTKLPASVVPKKRGRPKKVTADANETTKPAAKKSRTTKSEKGTDGDK